jgi:hypothetical protein
VYRDENGHEYQQALFQARIYEAIAIFHLDQMNALTTIDVVSNWLEALALTIAFHPLSRSTGARAAEAGQPTSPVGGPVPRRRTSVAGKAGTCANDKPRHCRQALSTTRGPSATWCQRSVGR